MPIISQFYGILIYMYKEIGGHHNKPHIHVKYNEYTASIIIETGEMEGNMPIKQKKIIDAWVEIHRDELLAAWHAYNNDGVLIKIKGLE